MKHHNLFLLSGVLRGCSMVAVSAHTEEAVCDADGLCQTDEDLLRRELERCDGTIIDAHLHTAPWFDDGETLSNALMEASIGVGLLYNPYPNFPLTYDVNEYVTGIAESSQGHVYALASLNTTHEDWDMHRDFERKRLARYLQHDLVLGAKLAPPHTCLKLHGQRMDDVIEVVSESDKKVLAIHIGTTPFCGPLGKQFNIITCCDRDYVDPRLLVPYIEKHPDITFVLLHSGHEFLPQDSPFYFNFEFVDSSIDMATRFSNVYLSLSAMFARDPETHELRYPGGFENTLKFKQANVVSKLFWGSDASWRKEDIKVVLTDAIHAMLKAGYTAQERTWVLCRCARQVFKIPTSESAKVD